MTIISTGQTRLTLDRIGIGIVNSRKFSSSISLKSRKFNDINSNRPLLTSSKLHDSILARVAPQDIKHIRLFYSKCSFFLNNELWIKQKYLKMAAVNGWGIV